MPMTVTLDTFTLGEVLTLVGQTGKTGTLEIQAGGPVSLVYFQEGGVAGAEAGEHSGPVDDFAALRQRLDDVFFELLRIRQGTGTFTPGPVPQEGVQVRVDVERLIAEANRRLEQWQVIELAIPSLEHRPTLARELPNDVYVAPDRWRVLAALDGRRPVVAVARYLDMSNFELCRVLKWLIDDGLVEIQPPLAEATPPPAAVAPPPTLTPPVVTSAAPTDPAPPAWALPVEEPEAPTPEPVPQLHVGGGSTSEPDEGYWR